MLQIFDKTFMQIFRPEPPPSKDANGNQEEHIVCTTETEGDEKAGENKESKSKKTPMPHDMPCTFATT